MRSFLTLTLLFLLLNSFAVATPTIVPAPPGLSAKAWLLIDHNSGRVLVEHNSHQRVEPASLTKMMTAYVVLYTMRNGSVSAEDMVRVSEKAWRMKGSRMFIEVNSLVRLDNHTFE